MRKPSPRGSAQPPLWNPPPAVASQAYVPQTYIPQRTAWVPPASPEAQAPAPIHRASDAYAHQTPSSIYDVPEPQGEEASAAEPALRNRRDEASTQAQAAPTAGYAQQAALATPPRLRPANGGGVRFYSVHRPFGLQPDPAPIPPQFFAATPDLSDPPGPSSNRKIAAGAGVSTAAARSAVQAQEGDASQP